MLNIQSNWDEEHNLCIIYTENGIRWKIYYKEISKKSVERHLVLLLRYLLRIVVDETFYNYYFLQDKKIGFSDFRLGTNQ